MDDDDERKSPDHEKKGEREAMDQQIHMKMNCLLLLGLLHHQDDRVRVR